MLENKANRMSSKVKRTWLASALAYSLASVSGQFVTAQQNYPDAANTPLETLYFPHSQFKIPFNVDARGTQPTQVQLWVSTDGGATWQMQGAANSSQKQFEFRAAAEGLYLFSVQTLDENGKAFPSPQPPLRIMIDTTKPQVALRPDVNANGQVVVDVRISEEHLKADSVRLRYRTDQDVDWREVAVTNIVAAGQIFEGQAVLDIPNCREVGFVVTVADEASNVGEASAQYVMPRTAAAPQDMKLASQRNGSAPTNGSSSTSTLVPTPGAVVWPNAPVGSMSQAANVGPTGQLVQPSSALTSNQRPQTSANSPMNIQIAPQAQANTNQGGWSVSGQLASGNGGLDLTPPNPKQNFAAGAEELPAPQPLDPNANSTKQYLVDKQPAAQPNVLEQKPTPTADSPSNRTTPPLGSFDSGANQAPSGQAFHCNSRSFSLDYALNAAAGSALADVELWGTEDGGSTWQKWGSDPDRQSPFDVQVANDGLFGFRMVIVSQNGKVSNRPKDGDSGDAWIHVDVTKPVGKITRAVYGDGHEAGMLVIDYNCADDNLHDRPITLSYSESQTGPWIPLASGLKNTGIYLWKADTNLPENIFLRMEAIDKAGNVGVDVMTLPINVQGLSPRGRIQGFRPIANPE